MRQYVVGDAIDELASLESGSAKLIHLDDAWARPQRNGEMGVEYDTHALDISFEIIDECWRVLSEDGWLICDADDWFKLKLENYLCEEYENVAETYDGGGYRRTGGVTYLKSDGSVSRGGAGMYLRNGGYHVVFAHKPKASQAYESARQVTHRPNEDYGWNSVKPIEPYERWVDALTESGELVVVPCAGTAPAAIAAERLGREWLAIDVEHGAKEAFERRKNAELGEKQATLGVTDGTV